MQKIELNKNANTNEMGKVTDCMENISNQCTIYFQIFLSPNARKFLHFKSKKKSNFLNFLIVSGYFRKSGVKLTQLSLNINCCRRKFYCQHLHYSFSFIFCALELNKLPAFTYVVYNLSKCCL